MSDTIDITTMNDWVDSRDLIRRREDLVWAIGMGLPLTESEQDEFDVLEQFVKFGETCTEWNDGTEVIADVGWEEFARSNITGQMPDQPGDEWQQFLLRHINWKSVIDEMQTEYRDFTVMHGHTPYTFWVRN